MEYNQKITATHLKRRAELYIRQSTMKQVYENAESTLQQYALKNRLVDLGWSEDRIVVIDCDLGRSGADAAGRDGFKQLVADVGSGEAGAVACIECSRLSRNSSDWGRLMEICAITKTVLIDADGVYDPNDFNDRILLGLKGTINEAELHFIRARMYGGKLNKARRGELRTRLPVGYVYDEGGRVAKDPDDEIRGAVQLLFDSFRRIGSANGTAAFFNEKGYKYPVNTGYGFKKSEVQWKTLTSSKVYMILHNPIYAGTYSYGRRRTERTLEGKKIRNASADEIVVCLENHHECYISVDEYYENIEKMKANNTRKSGSVPREGAALLQGIAVCGRCGHKMAVYYHKREDGTVNHYYSCSKNGWRGGGDRCQSVKGAAPDTAVSDMILETLTPMTVSAAIEIEKESRRRKNVSDNYFLMRVERAQYELGLAKSRYMSVDPANRLVAFELEKLWNTRIVELTVAEEELERHNREKDAFQLNDSLFNELEGLAEDVHKVWRSGKMRIQDKKRIVRSLIESVTIIKGNSTITLGIIFKSGALKSIELDDTKPFFKKWKTTPEVLDYIRSESTAHNSKEISDLLNQNGYKSGKDEEFTSKKVRYLMEHYEIPSLKSYFRSKGYLYAKEKADLLGISVSQLGKLRQKGVLECKWEIVDEKPVYMYAPIQ
jgi:DNA invertase Pin-like site-specific DNA recombinase/DNA-directed RNA polymerase subunit M/transcription elongation factor TFIIS